MKERGIIFKAEMVRATLDGRKTQTRRIVKGEAEFIDCLTGDCPHEKQRECDAAIAAECPYGVAGDRLWVRETWAPYDDDVIPEKDRSGIGYRADVKWRNAHPNEDHRWRPSIFMPRWASRITLEITKVRVERVQHISYPDCGAEGVNPPNKSTFMSRWDSINGKGAWDRNPWVWVVEFRKL